MKIQKIILIQLHWRCLMRIQIPNQALEVEGRAVTIAARPITAATPEAEMESAGEILRNLRALLPPQQALRKPPIFGCGKVLRAKELCKQAILSTIPWLLQTR